MTVNHPDAGSIPAAAAEVIYELRGRLTVGHDALNVVMLVRLQLPQLARGADIPVCQDLRNTTDKNVCPTYGRTSQLAMAAVPKTAER